MGSMRIRKPTPNPSQEGNKALMEERLIPLLGGVKGGLKRLIL